MNAGDRCVLLVDDDPDERFITRQAWAQAGIAPPLREADGGDAAIAYLSGSGEYADRARFPSPLLVLLDVKMPGVTGFAVLSWIRASEDFARLPVIMLTASTSPQDVDEAYRRGANSFLVKPSSLEELVAMLRALDRYWFAFNEFPFPNAPPRPRSSS